MPMSFEPPRAVVLLVLVAVGALPSLAAAQGPVPQSGVLKGCYSKTQLRLVDTATACKPNEAFIEWNSQGLTGAQGVQGEMGPQGPQGVQGVQGVQGEKGDTGETGAQGIQGEKGDTGETGAQGIQGEKGDTGETGAQGIQGVQGVQGEMGPQGPQGIQGIQGIQGEKGAKGDTGAQGEQGIHGVKGDTGEQGPIGAPGPEGDQGAQGAAGPAGADGAPGADGAVGPQGPVGPQGEKGDTGAQGPEGPQGPQGDTGPQGPAGSGGLVAARVEGPLSVPPNTSNGTTPSVTSGTPSITLDVPASGVILLGVRVTRTDNLTGNVYIGLREDGAPAPFLSSCASQPANLIQVGANRHGVSSEDMCGSVAGNATFNPVLYPSMQHHLTTPGTHTYTLTAGAVSTQGSPATIRNLTLVMSTSTG